MSFIHSDVNMVIKPNVSYISDNNVNMLVTSNKPIMQSLNESGLLFEGDNRDTHSGTSVNEASDELANVAERKPEIEIKIVLVKLEDEPWLSSGSDKDKNTPPITNKNYTGTKATLSSATQQQHIPTSEQTSTNPYSEPPAFSVSRSLTGQGISDTPSSEFDGTARSIPREYIKYNFKNNKANTESDKYKETSNNNNYSEPTKAALYSDFRHTTTTTHTHQYNLYPQDFFSNIDGERPKHNKKMNHKVDAVGRITGEWGRWQLRTVLLIFLCKIPSSWFMACIIFTAPSPRHGEFFCKPPNAVGAQNETLWIKVAHPQKEEIDDQEFSIDFCNVYQDAQEHAHHYYRYERPELEPRVWEEPTSRNANIIPCQQFEHRTEYHSAVTQYDLVCSRDILVSVTQFFHLFGVLTGGILANHLLKYFSPRNVMLFGMVAQIFCGTLTGLVASYELHVFFRCLSAVCCAQMYTAGGMIMADITGGVYKTCVSTLFEQFWSIGVILLPGVASFFTSWSHLYMAISWPTLILIYLWRWIPDSPRWMIQRGRLTDAKDILMQCIEVNGTSYGLPYDIDQQLQLQAQTAMDAPPPPGWWSIWKGDNVIRNLICVHLAWSIYIVVYYGMLLNIRSFSREHLEINTVVAGMSEIIGTFIGLFLILKTTRKWIWTGLFNVVAGLIAYLGWLVPKDLPFDARVALLMLSAMVSKVAISTTLSILTTCTVELVSDEKKKITFFSAICWARFWLLGAPFIGATIVFGMLVPQTAFATLAIIGGIFTALISSPRTISKQKPSFGYSNRATATQLEVPFDARVALLMLSAMVSKVAISTTLSILTTCTVELVSDEKKKITFFSAICWARFWLLGAPFIGATIVFGMLVPQTAFATLAIIGGIFTALISSPRTISKQKPSFGYSNRATATQLEVPFDARVALLMLSAMVSKVAISTTLSILTTCTVELVSDEKKKITFFSAICWARFWLLGAPFIGATIVFGMLVPQTAFATLAIIGGIFTALISSPRTISKQKPSFGYSNRATATQLEGIDNKAYTRGPTPSHHIFTTITKLAAPASNLPPEMAPGIWTSKNHEDSPSA